MEGADKTSDEDVNVVDELISMVKLSLPVMVAQSAFILMNVTDSIFLGQIGPTELAASAIGGSFTTCVMYFAVGLSFGMDTIVSQAFGARNMYLMGMSFQTACFVTTLACIPLFVLLWFTEPILIAFYQKPEVAQLAGVFNRWSILGIWPYAIYYCIAKYLTNQRIVHPSMVVGIIGIVLNVPFNMIFIWALDMGMVGSALATAVSRFTMVVFIVSYLLYSKIYVASSPRIFKESFYPSTIFTYLKISVPAAFMVAFEVTAWYAMTILVGLFQNTIFIDVHTIAFNIIYFVFIFCFGWATAMTVRIGNLMGQGNYRAAQTVSLIGFSVAYVGGLSTTLIVWLLRYELIKIWSSDPHLIPLGGRVIAIAALAEFFDTLNYAIGGILKGLGRQNYGSMVVFFSYYLVAFPTGITLAYVVKMKVEGYWWGLSSGLFVSVFLILGFLLMVDWKHEAQLAYERTKVQVGTEDGGVSTYGGIKSSTVDDTENPLVEKRKSRDHVEEGEP